jgi:3-deoxy-D-manno-octulosonic-acid transferase
MFIHFLYNLSIRLYSFLLIFVSIFNKKAELLVEGRRKSLATVRSFRLKYSTEPLIWMHCASLGEYEQGKYLLQELKRNFPHKKIALSFYSPSGYEVLARSLPSFIDTIFYLPADTESRMQTLVSTLHPELFILVKYEFWLNLLRALREFGVARILISTQIEKSHFLFTKFGKLHFKEVANFEQIFTIREMDKAVLQEKGVRQVTVAGDTRIESSISNLRAGIEFIDIESHASKFEKVMVYGSIWKDDLPVLEEFIKKTSSYLHIIAPHDINPKNINDISKNLGSAHLWGEPYTHNCIIVNTIGTLKYLYQYADVVYIGGGFHNGLHNTLEAAVWDKAIIFGKDYAKFQEAVDFVNLGLAVSVGNANEFKEAVERLLKESPSSITETYQTYFSQQKKSSDIIINYLRHL